MQVHTSEQAASSAQSISARAFTIGQNVVFGAGQFAPSTTEGKRLLAHELTHVVQQTGENSSSQFLSARSVLQLQRADATPTCPVTVPIPTGETYTFNSIQLAENEPFLHHQMQQLVIQEGRAAPLMFLDSLEQFYAKDELAAARQFKKDFEKGEVSGGVPLSQEEFERYDAEKARILKIFSASSRRSTHP